MNETMPPGVETRDFEISDRHALIAHPVVSVLMLAYNHGPYLGQAIDGVLAQCADVALELLIGEDCSPDNTREIALAYQRANPAVVRVITSDKNVGATHNHRRLLPLARGRFHAYLDGDDYWLPGKLSRQVAFLDQHEECVAVFTNALTIDREGQAVGLFNDVGNIQVTLAQLLRLGNFFNNSSLLYRAMLRDCLLEINVPSIDYRGHLRIARHGTLAQIAEPLVAYRIDSSASMLARNNDRVRQFYWDAILSVPPDCVSKGDIARGMANFLRRVVLHALRHGKWHLLREWPPRVFAASPFGRLHMSLLVAASLLRITAKELAGRWRKGPDGRRLRVLYRR